MANLPVVAMTRKTKMTKKRKNTRAVMGPASKARPTKALTQVVKSIIRREEETKFRGKDVVTAVFNGKIASSNECYALLPQLLQGDTAQSRNADKIKPVSFTLNGSVCIVSAPYKRIRVRVLVLTSKQVKDSALINAVTGVQPGVPITQLINDGQTDGGVTFDGTVQKRDFPVNLKLFNVLSDRSYDLCQASGTSVSGDPHMPAEGEAGAVPGAITSDCNVKSFKHFRLKIKCPATLSFNGAASNYPNNFAPFICMGYTSYDTNPASTTTAEVALSVNSMLRYDDA